VRRSQQIGELERGGVQVRQRRTRRREGRRGQRELGPRLGQHLVGRDADHSRPDDGQGQGQGLDVYKHYAGAAVAQLLHGKWLKTPIVGGRFGPLAALTSISQLFGKVAANHGKLANEGKKTFNGQQVVEIRDTSDNSKLYVAATGKPYPVAIVGGKQNQSGTISFGDWNAPVSLSAPKDAIDISSLGGG
jgi:hypothetical protein